MLDFVSIHWYHGCRIGISSQLLLEKKKKTKKGFVKDSPQMGIQKSTPKNQNHHEKSIFHFWSRNVPGAPRWCGVTISR